MSPADTICIPAARGKAAAVPSGQHITVINTHGSQVLDTWAFNADDPAEHMSMAHSRSFNSRIYPRVGDALSDQALDLGGFHGHGFTPFTTPAKPAAM